MDNYICYALIPKRKGRICYVVGCRETSRVALIDPVMEHAPRYRRSLKRQGLDLQVVLQTRGFAGQDPQASDRFSGLLDYLGLESGGDRQKQGTTSQEVWDIFGCAQITPVERHGPRNGHVPMRVGKRDVKIPLSNTKPTGRCVEVVPGQFHRFAVVSPPRMRIRIGRIQIEAWGLSSDEGGWLAYYFGGNLLTGAYLPSSVQMETLLTDSTARATLPDWIFDLPDRTVLYAGYLANNKIQSTVAEERRVRDEGKWGQLVDFRDTLLSQD